jgi:hypothetical protein
MRPSLACFVHFPLTATNHLTRVIDPASTTGFSARAQTFIHEKGDLKASYFPELTPITLGRMNCSSNRYDLGQCLSGMRVNLFAGRPGRLWQGRLD